MKQGELQALLARSLFGIVTAALGSLAVGYLLRRLLTPKPNDADLKAALAKLYEIEVDPHLLLLAKIIISKAFSSN
jgi:hypothetical protein